MFQVIYLKKKALPTLRYKRKLIINRADVFFYVYVIEPLLIVINLQYLLYLSGPNPFGHVTYELDL